VPAIVLKPAALPAIFAEDLACAIKFARAEKAESTRRAYRSDFAQFTAWCSARGVNPLPASPETTAAFLASEAEKGLKPSTVGRRAAAVAHAHKLAGHEPPTNSEVVKATVRGIRRTMGTAPVRRAPAIAEITCRMAKAASPSRMKGLRDRALLLLGFGGAFRRSELVALDVSDITFDDEGMKIRIRLAREDGPDR
jgi:site-specific recombinase XerD